MKFTNGNWKIREEIEPKFPIIYRRDYDYTDGVTLKVYEVTTIVV